MYDTATRVRLAQQCARTRRRKREQRKTQGLFVVCMALLGSLLGTLNAVRSPEPPALEGLYGAMLLHENAGGYVLVGVTAFTAAVVITVLCIRYRERTKKHDAEQEKPTNHERDTIV